MIVIRILPLARKTYKFNLNKISHLARVDLSANRLETVESYVFADCAHLTELHLRENRLVSLAADAFHATSALRTLDLAENRLVTLGDALRDLHSLRHLNVSGNRLTMLDWSQLPEELATLSAARNEIALLGAAARSQVRRLEVGDEIRVIGSSELNVNFRFNTTKSAFY